MSFWIIGKILHKKNFNFLTTPSCRVMGKNHTFAGNLVKNSGKAQIHSIDIYSQLTFVGL